VRALVSPGPGMRGRSLELKRRFQKPGAGFSLAEVVVVIVVVSLAVPPMAMLLHQTLVGNAQSNMQTTAVALARGLMEEILSKSFEDPQGELGSFGTEEGARAGYDDVDDYDGLNDMPPKDSQGNTMNSYSAFRTRVTVENVASGSPGGSAQADGSTHFKRVTITVEWNGGDGLIRLVGLASSFGIDQYPAQSGLTFVERLGTKEGKEVKFQFRNDTGSDFYATHLTATWTSPTAYYQQIKVKIEGGTDHKEVWKYEEYNDIRLATAETAMFNQGQVVLVPAGAVVKVEMKDFKTDRVGGEKGNDAYMDDTSLVVEIWGAPDKYQPFTVTLEE